MVRRVSVVGLWCAVLAGCQAPLRPIFPAVAPPIVWPAPPDSPRIRYIGELRGEASLGVSPSGWQAFQAVLIGPRPTAEFVRPSAVAVAGERVFIADLGLGVVHLLDLETRRYAMLRGSPDDPLRVPIDVTIVPGRALVVADRGRGALDVFDLDGNWQVTRHVAGVSAPISAAWDAARNALWVVDPTVHACLAVPMAPLAAAWAPTEQVTQRLGGRGDAPGAFNFPTAVTWHAQGGLVVADAMNFRVQFFDDALAAVASFGQKGDAAGDFARPRDVAVDSEGHIYVLDNQFENIQVFDRGGRLLMAFGQGGDRPGEFALPAGLTIAAQDRIWVADSYNRRVQVFQYLSEKASCVQ